MLDSGFLTLAQLKEAVLPKEQRSQNEHDNRFKRIGLGVASKFNRHCGRVFERKVGAEWSFTADRTSLSLTRYPLEAVTTVELICGGGTRDITDDIESIGNEAGTIYFGRVLGSYRDRVAVTYTGGYWLDDGNAMPDGATPLDADILNAFEIQVQAVMEHTNFLGTGANRTDAEGRGGPKLMDLDLIDYVVKTLKPYRRFG